MIQFEYFNYKLKQNSATKIKQTVGAITPPDGYAFGVLSALTNLETVSSTLITGYNAVFIHTLNSQVPTESAVNAFVTDVASGKVDKTNVAYRLYGTDANGNQTTFPIGVNNLRDVQVDGVSVVDTDGIANIDLTGYVRTDGTSIMTGPLLMRATESFKCAIAPYWDGVGFFKLNDNNSVTLMASIEYNSGFEPATTNTYNIGALTRKWKNLYLSGKAYVSVINNGYDIAIPVTNSADTLALKSEVDLAANSGDQLTEKGVWYAKMYSATVAPSAEDGTNYADFSQTDNQGNPIIVIYKRQNGAWVQDQTITPPAEYNGYVPVTSKIWDIVEQSGQQGGKVLWSHNQKTFTPSPLIISTDGLNITNSTISTSTFSGSVSLSGTSTVVMPAGSGDNQITNKKYVDDAISSAVSGSSDFDLFDTKWRDATTNNPRWALSDGNWKTNANAYQHLVDDIGIETVSVYAWEYRGFTVYTKSATPLAGDKIYNADGTLSIFDTVEYDSDGSTIYDGYNTWDRNSSADTTITIINATQQTETIAGVTITYYPSADGHKIVLADQETNANSIYTATGVAWYYILDTVNERFKLPRSKHEHYGNRPVIGNGMALGITDGSHNMGLGQSAYSGIDYNRLYANSSHYGQNVSSSGSINTGGNYAGILGIATDETKSGVISTPVEDTVQYKYLYFYVGN